MIARRICRPFGMFDFLGQPFEKLKRLGVHMKNPESLRFYRDLIKLTRRIYWNDYDGTPWYINEKGF